MPKINGFELREQIMSIKEIGSKCVPYIFLSTSKNPENVLKAYSCNVQGYFKKQEESETDFHSDGSALWNSFPR